MRKMFDFIMHVCVMPLPSNLEVVEGGTFLLVSTSCRLKFAVFRLDGLATI
jgi:hypothetical protein